MRYYVVIIENTVNGENRTVPYAYDNEDSARAKYYQLMATDISAEAVIGFCAWLLASTGGFIDQQTWGTMEKYVTDVTE